ncbi:MAG: glycosyltransferase [Spirochaetes bacterium]|nr:glycosyltransferase [Spirochaetota bacterium]
MINKKVLLITNIIPPYRIAVFNYLKEKIKNFNVWALSYKEINRNWNIDKNSIKFNCEVLKSLSIYIKVREFTIHFTSIGKKLKNQNADIIIITGYDQFAFWQALFYARKYNKKIILWNGSTLLYSKLKKGMFYQIKKYFLKKIDGFITYGTKATEYLKYFHVPEEKIITGCNTVDISWFIKNSQNLKKNELYEELKINNMIKLLFIGRLIKFKGLNLLLNALSELKQKNIILYIIGSGNDEDFFKDTARSNNLVNVKFCGYLQKSEIIYYYSICDYLIFPTLNENWGLVINEALSCGLPVLSSIYAGGSHDLIKEGVNGFIFDPLDKRDFVNKLKKIILHKFNRNEVKNSIKKITSEYYSEKILNAIRLKN